MRFVSEQLAKLYAYVTRMDVRAVRSVSVIVGLLIGVVAIFLLGLSVIGGDEGGRLTTLFNSMRDSPFAILGVIAAFTILAFVGAPQSLLYAVTVAVFGAWLGFIYAYTATLISASVNFWLARWIGAERLRRLGWSAVERISQLVGRNGFWASLLVRWVPTGPFIFVNMGLGLTRTPYLAFLAGTAIGVPAKMTVIVFMWGTVEAAMAGSWSAIGWLAAAAGGWVGIALLARWLLRRREGAL